MLTGRAEVWVVEDVEEFTSEAHSALFRDEDCKHATYAFSWLFSVVLTVVGGLAVVVAILPGSWVEKACKIQRHELSAIPVKTLGAFAVVSYLSIVGLSFAPHSRHPSHRFSRC